MVATARDAISQLPPLQRDVLTLSVRGLTHKEISGELGITIAHSRVLLFKARVLIKSAIKG